MTKLKLSLIICCSGLSSTIVVTLKQVKEVEWTTLLIRWLSRFGGTIVNAVDYLLA